MTGCHVDVLVVGAGPAGSATAIHLARSGASVLLADRARFPRDKACGGGVTGRALRQVPCDITPVVERIVDTFELRLHHRRSFRRTSAEPLIVMTQRRRLDAYLAEQAVAAGARFQDGTKVERIVIGENGVSASVGGESVTADVLVGADGSNGTVAKAAGLDAGIDRGIALEGNVAWSLLDEERFASTAVIEIGAPAGGYGWLFPKGDHANLGVGGWAREGPHLRDHLARLARAYDVDPDAITGLRGHQLPMRRIGASTPASSRAILVGDAAGLIDPLSGDGMYEAFVLRPARRRGDRCGRSREVPRGTCTSTRSSRRCLLDCEARARSAPRGVLLGRALAGRVRRRRGPPQGGRGAPRRGPGSRAPSAAPDRTRRSPPEASPVG